MPRHELANVNGVITPLHAATVPVADHGFLYGESVYETLRTYGGRPFLVERHLDRLERSAAAIRLQLPWGRGQLVSEIERTLAQANDAGTGLVIRIIASRGPGPLGYDPSLCAAPTLVILVRDLDPVPAGDRDVGIHAVVATVRRNPIEALNPRIKSSNLLNNILAAHQALDAGASEAILFNTSGYLAEGTLTNVFMVREDLIMTPSLECGILSGLTRELLLELARAGGMRCEEGLYLRQDLNEADEVLLTSTTREVLPVARLDSHPVGAGSRGPVTRKLQEMFRRRVEATLA